MNIKVDKNGVLRLESNAPLTAEMLSKIEKRIERKAATLKQMKSDYDSGKFDEIFKKL